MGWLDIAINEAVNIFVVVFRLVFQVGRIGAARADQARRTNQSKKPYLPDVLEPERLKDSTAPSHTPEAIPIYYTEPFLKSLTIGGGLLLLIGLCAPNAGFWALVGLGMVVSGWVLRSQHPVSAVVAARVIPTLHLSSVPV